MLGARREAYYSLLLENFGPSYANFDPLSARVGIDVTFTCDILQLLLSSELADHGLSKSTYSILVVLRHGPSEGMQLHDLGELLLVSRANVTGLIDHLEQKRFVTRTVDETDRRARYARITAKGEALLERVVPIHNQRVQALLGGLSAEDKRALVKLLKKMRESLAAGRDICHAKLPIRMRSEKD